MMRTFKLNDCSDKKKTKEILQTVLNINITPAEIKLYTSLQRGKCRCATMMILSEPATSTVINKTLFTLMQLIDILHMKFFNQSQSSHYHFTCVVDQISAYYTR